MLSTGWLESYRAPESKEIEISHLPHDEICPASYATYDYVVKQCLRQFILCVRNLVRIAHVARPIRMRDIR